MMRQRFKRLCAAFLTMVLLAVGVAVMPGLSVLAFDTDYPNTWVNTGNQVEDLIGVALTQVGYHGVEYQTGTKYGAWYGNTYAPWCGMFISWCADQAGIPTSVIIKSARANDFRLSGTYHYKTAYTPQRGDLVLYNPDDGNGYFFPAQNADGTYSRTQHVALVIGYYPENDTIEIVHGNATGDRVCRSTKVVSSICIQAFVTPRYTSGTSTVDVNEPDSDFISDADGANLRSGPATTNEKLGVLPFGTRVDVLESVRDNDGDLWYRIRVKGTGQEGYVFGSLVTTVKAPEEHKEPKDCINGSDVRLRSTPDTSSNSTILTVLQSGQVVTVEEQTTDAAGDIWYKISVTVGGKSYTGYVFGAYVTVVSERVPEGDPLANHNYVSADDVRLRESPVDGNVLTTLKENQVVELIAKTTGSDGKEWYKLTALVSGMRYTGYIAAQYLQINVPITVKLNGNLEAPSVDSTVDLGLTRALAIRGWAFSNQGYTENFYQIDQGAKTPLTVSARPDVLAAYGNDCPGEDTGFLADADVSELTAGTHTLTVYACGGTEEKVLFTRTFRVTDSSLPTCDAYEVTDVSADGFSLSLCIEDPAGIASVRFAVWTASHGQADLHWITVGPDNQKRYALHVSTADYLTAYDTYVVHVYASDRFGNECCVKTFELNPATYAPIIIHYAAQGDTVCPEDQTLDYLNGGIRLSDQTPVADQAVFLGWSLTPGGQTADYLPGAMVRFTRNTTLYAVFRAEGELADGDVNGDGAVDTADLMLLKQYLAGLCSSPVGSMDLTNDNAVDTADLVAFKQMLAGLR